MTHLLYVARDVITLNNVLNRADEAQNSSKSADNNGLYAQYPHYNAHGSGKIILENLFMVLVGDLLCLTTLCLCLAVHQPHVEEGREHEGEAGDEHRADQLEDGAEAGQGLGHEGEDQHHAAPEHNPLPVEGRLDAEDVLNELVRRVKEHRISGDQVNQQQDLHDKLDGAVTEDTGDA